MNTEYAYIVILQNSLLFRLINNIGLDGWRGVIFVYVKMTKGANAAIQYKSFGFGFKLVVYFDFVMNGTTYPRYAMKVYRLYGWTAMKYH